MARTRPKPLADHERILEPASPFCAECGKRMQIAYHNKRHLRTLQGRLALTVPVRVCRYAACRALKKPYGPSEEGALALPQSECGLDLIAFVGHCRYTSTRAWSSSIRHSGSGRLTCASTVSPISCTAMKNSSPSTWLARYRNSKRRGAWSSLSTACSLTKGTRYSGCCAIVSPAPFCWQEPAQCRPGRSRSFASRSQGGPALYNCGILDENFAAC